MNPRKIGVTLILSFILNGITHSLGRLSRPAALRLGRGLGWIYGSVIRHRRSEALTALSRSFPDWSENERQRILKAMYRNFAVNYVEIMRLAGGADDDLRELVVIEGEEIVQDVLRRGKGALVLTAHLGNFDLLAMFTAQRGYPLTIISKEIKNPALNDLWMRLRERYGVKIVLSHNSMRACFKALKGNGLLGFILDQNRPHDQGIFVTFFDRPACTTPGLAFISAVTQAPVLPVFIHRTDDGRHHVRVLPAIEPPADREEETLRSATQQYTTIIEQEVRRHPDQWTWVHRRWKTRPKPGDKIAMPAGG
jgi:KDO2-lipid IV(A) lauroyltransferase